MVAKPPVDFRKGAEGLAALVKAEIGGDPFSGTIYVFRAKRADRIKLVLRDGSGVCLVSGRLEDGELHWPGMPDGAMRLTALKNLVLLREVENARLRQIIKELQRHRFGCRAQTLSEDQLLPGRRGRTG